MNEDNEPAMTPREAAGVLAQCAWLKAKIKETEAVAKDVLLHSVEGGERKRAVLPDGTKLGSVTVVEGARNMKIDNDQGFLAWVKQRYPHEIVQTVRESFVKICADKVKDLGHLPDANGEVCPHVSLVRNAEYAKVTLDKMADGIMQDMITRRSLPELLDYGTEDVIAQAISEPTGTAVSAVIVSESHPEDAVLVDMREVSQNDSVDPEPQSDPEPFIEEGPPYWRDSNTFEQTDSVRQRRGR